MAKTIGTRVLTANRLGDGRVVYLGSQGWTTCLGEARLVLNDADAARAETAGRAGVAAWEIVEPYLIDVESESDGVMPARLRERIRADGPTTGNSLRAGEDAAA